MQSTIPVLKIHLVPVDSTNLETYLSVGTRSYREHYLHLWENEDPTPYISHGLTKEVVQRELEDPNNLHFLINHDTVTVGILKLVKDCGIDEIPKEEALKAEKIYFLQEHSGKGFGKQVLQYIEDFARSIHKKTVWLDTMQKGNPILFYQKNGYAIKRESEVVLPGAKPSEKAMWILTKNL
ncbi:GNAT family N-acetyltransferase [Flagellimonas aequoris]|nr:GNAT family N-acetyltransferase [Allomuricauda aequoris]